MSPSSIGTLASLAARGIPKASWQKTTISNDPVLNARHPDVKIGSRKFEKLPSDQQHIPKNIIQNQHLLLPLTASCPNLVLKVQNWKEWAYTDGSCHIHLGKRVVEAGVFHPDSDSLNCATKRSEDHQYHHTMIVRAGLTAKAAAILHGHSHIATDSLPSHHQIRKQTLYPELHSQHTQGHILGMIVQLICNSPTPIYLYKVKSHAGIAGNECADAIAKHQAIQGDDILADTTFPCVNLAGNPFHATTWLAFEEAARSHASISERPDSPAPKLNILPTFMML
eukprot:1148835-Pelagomonas_calceolata.AAC.1